MKQLDAMPTTTLARASHAPRVASAHIVSASNGRAMLAVDSGRVYMPDDSLLEAIDQSMAFADELRVRMLMATGGMLAPGPAATPVPQSVPVRSISLAIAAKCNLGCTYCYAEQGDFGGSGKAMPIEVALKSIDALVHDARPGERVRLVFLGGEPLINRKALREATTYAARTAAAKGIAVDYALTTNATLLTAEDADFLDAHAFAVTISIDGVGAAHDLTRPDRSGRGTYERVVERARLLLNWPERRCHVAARVSVTPSNLELPATLAELGELGFDSIQFAPVLSSPGGRSALDAASLDRMLEQLIACSRLFEEHLVKGRLLPFANLTTTLARIDRGARDEYPCGAGGSYLGVSADGGLFACHRFVNDEDARMGSVDAGLDAARQADWLAQRNVRFQEPCRSCWARHLCGGSCHYDVINRGRPACDYIRGWLDHCLGLYVRLAMEQPSQLARILSPQPRATG